MVEVPEVFQQPRFQSLYHDLLFHCRFPFVFLFVIFQTNCDITYLLLFYVLQHGRQMYDSVAEVLSILATSRSCGSIHCSSQHYQPGKITLHFSVPMIKYLVATSYELWMM